MNHWQKLGLPVALGICAAFLNWQSISRKLEPRVYVATKANVKPGEMLTKESLTPINLSYASEVSLENTLVPWSKVTSLIGRYAQRNLPASTPLTQFDIAEANMSEKADSEDEIEVRMTANERQNSLFFVNDWVNTRNEEGVPLDGCRVLSVTRCKEDYCVRLAVNADQLRKFNSRTQPDSQLRIYGRAGLQK